MIPRYSFDVSEHLDLVRVTMAGFFTPADVGDFVEAHDTAHSKLRCADNEHVTLVDIRDMKIQSQEAVVEFQAMLANRKHQGRRLAIVVGSSLARSQVKRAAAGRAVEYFTTIADAEAWLLSDRNPFTNPGLRAAGTAATATVPMV